MKWIVNNIRTKLTISIILSVFILLTVLLMLSYSLLKNYSLKNALELSDTILNETDSKITRFFLEIDYLADSLKRNSTVYDIKLDQMKELFISTVFARKEYLRAIYLGTFDGKMYEWGYGEGFTNNTPSFPEDYDPRVRPWYKEALQAKGFTVSRPYIYASIHALGITCVVPVIDKKKEFIGVLGLDIMLQGLSNMIRNLQVQKQGKVILLNQNYEILANQFNEYTDNITQLEKFKYSELISSDNGYFISDFENRKMLTSYKLIGPTGWILLVAIPYDVILEFSNQTLAVLLLSEIFSMFLLIVIITALLHRIITDPLGRMIKVMESIEYGNADERIQVKGNDEFAVLGNMFNQLEDIRKEYTTGIEREIENRTKEITILQQENTRLRIIEEKERIFGNLHDSLGARLTNIFISNNVARNATGNNKLLNDMLTRIEKNTKLGIKDLKEIIFGPVAGDRVIIDFAKLLEFNIKERLKLKNITFYYKPSNMEEINELDSSLRFEIEKLLQEIISNVLKHAGAKSVHLDLNVENNMVLIYLKDDGIGFDYTENKDTGFGINSIIGRIKRLGGTVEIESSPGNGVSFQISIPVEQDSEL